jgi:hypothetical protein
MKRGRPGGVYKKNRVRKRPAKQRNEISKASYIIGVTEMEERADTTQDLKNIGETEVLGHGETEVLGAKTTVQFQMERDIMVVNADEEL